MPQIKGFNDSEYMSLTSIKGIGKVFAAGIIAEIVLLISFKTMMLCCINFTTKYNYLQMIFISDFSNI